MLFKLEMKTDYTRYLGYKLATDPTGGCADSKDRCVALVCVRIEWRSSFAVDPVRWECRGGVTGGRSENDTLVSIWAISQQVPTSTRHDHGCLLRGREESRWNARNKGEDKLRRWRERRLRRRPRPAGCTSCRLHCCSSPL